MAYYAGQKYYTAIQELDSGKGYVDLSYLPAPNYPDKPVLLIELKYGKSLETAADQIRKRNYPQKLEHYRGNLLLISINYVTFKVKEKEGEVQTTDASIVSVSKKGKKVFATGESAGTATVPLVPWLLRAILP